MSGIELPPAMYEKAQLFKMPLPAALANGDFHFKPTLRSFLPNGQQPKASQICLQLAETEIVGAAAVSYVRAWAVFCPKIRDQARL